MSYKVMRLSNQRWGIFYKSCLLATIGTPQEAQDMVAILNRRSMGLQDLLEEQPEHPTLSTQSRVQDSGNLKRTRRSRKVA